MQWIGSVFFTAFLFVWTFVFSIFFVVACCLTPLRLRLAMVRFWAWVLLTTLRATCRLDYRVEGRENLPPGNHIALWKHSSSWETLAMSLVFPDQTWILKKELTWIPFVGWGILQIRSIAIDRRSGNSAVNQVITQGKARLAEGLWIMVFPEGTRMPVGQTKRYGVSGVLLAAQTGKFIVPVAHDAGYYWPRRGLLKKPGTIRVKLGPPIVSEGRDPREVNAEAQAWIEATIAEMHPKAPEAA